ncbi:hypothetical protein C7212DRAFT_343574 [Tuber magnatum]|uniref:Uncharacterized protein n=1 Tax=Tuber magnatum TaxID=42249 RepID=A0A317SPX1_9PEZI|nr:hypothetical protein C7212DRAFT_343574 [Tuber magnatum]
MNKPPTENEPTVQDITSWDSARLLAYIQVNLSTPLNVGDAQLFLDAQIDGSVFLAGAGDSAFFKQASLSFGSSVKLAALSEKILGRNKLSDPAFETQLPFPFVLDTLPKRFNFGSNDGAQNWVYMGREKFAELLNKLKEVRESFQNSGFWLYGTRGYGKSHLLAALVCYLTARGERVVYIPDCRECVNDPVPYMKAAMLFAWGDDDQRESIMLLDTMEMIYHYFQSVRNVIFIIDELNALACLRGDSAQLRERKGQVEEWLLRYRTRHKLIQKEMEHWWKRNSHLILDGNKIRGGYTKDQVEDQTGCIPLFLNSCLVNGEIDLGVDILKKVWKQVQSFVSHTKRTVNRESWDLYCGYVHACIRRQATPTDVDPELIDHWYFYEWCPTSATRHEVGAYACGIARDAVVKQLHEYGKNKFGDADFLKALDEYIDNEAVTGFFIEENLLSTISLSGLEIGRNISKPMDMQIFRGYPTFTITEQPILYCPMQFNFHAIDGIVVRFDISNQANGKRGKCFMFPLQITIAKSHADSEYEFFKDWSKWIKDLDDYDLEVVFLWISAKEPWERKVKRYPEYISKNIHIGDVNRDTWERYNRALKSKNGRGQTGMVVPQKRVLRKQARVLLELQNEDKNDSSLLAFLCTHTVIFLPSTHSCLHAGTTSGEGAK